MSSARAKRVLTTRVLVAMAVLATMLVVGASAGTADASTCDATVADEAGLVAAAACYSTELAGSTTVVTLSGDVTLTSSLVLNNATTATFAIDGAGNTLTSVFDNTSTVDGIDVQAGHLILSELVYNAQAKTGVRLSPNTSVALTNTVIDAVTPVGTAVSGGQSGTSIVMTNSSIVGAFTTAVTSSGSVLMVDSTLSGRSGLRGFGGSQLTVTNSTLHGDLTGFSGTGLQADGTALLTGVTIKDYGSGGITGMGTVSLEGVLLANINNAACSAGLTVTDLFGNTVKDDSCGLIVGTEFQSSAALGLGPLDDNGCVASLVSCPKTVAITGVDSPAIDAWPGCALTDDQRGVGRTAGACDSGAYEGFDCPGDVGTPDQLEFGINCYNRAGAAITQSLTLTADVTLIEELPLIDNDTDAILAIDGAGHTLTTLDDEVGVFVSDGDLRLEDLTIAGASTHAIQLQGDSDLSLVESTITGTTGTAISGLSGANLSDVLLVRSELDGNHTGIKDVFNLTVDSSTITGSTGDAGSRGIVPGGGTTTIVNSTFAENDFALQIQGGTTTVINSTFAHNTTGIGMVGGASGTLTVIDSMSFNTTGACGPMEPSRMTDGGGNIMLGDCGSIDGIDVDPGDPDWLALLPALAQNACAAGVNCTRTVAPPAGFPTSGAGESCGLMVDQRGVDRPATNCDAGAVEIANELPVAIDDIDPGFTLTEDDPATVLDVLVNDTDADPGDTLVVLSASQPATGGVASVVNGELVFTPSPEFFGDAQFTYTMTDGSDATDSATVLVNVVAVNDPPVPVDDDITVPKNGTDRSEPASNDTDVEGTALTVVSVTQPPAGEGTTTVFNNQFVDYTPPIGFFGTTSFTYTVADADGATAVGTIFVEVTGANDPPIASPDSGDSTQNGDPILIEVLDNDTDVDLDELVLLSITQPQGGRTVLVGNDVEYTPNLDFFGSDSFTYVVSDGRGGTDTGTVNVTVAQTIAQLCNGLPVTIDMSSNGGNGVGTAGDDVILGTAGDDVIDAGDGNDTVCAGDGDDQVVGGTGDDTIFGEGGRDIVRGNPGSDTIDGGPGRDRLLGGIDDDTISGGDGDDYIGGFGGNDIIDGGPGNETIFGGFGADTIDGGLGNDKIFGLIGNDIINGGDGNDQLNGDRGNDTIRGGSGNDTINGGNANDTLFGEAGDDTVNGGKADDALSGGPDIDVCSGNLQTLADTVDGTCETFFGIP